MGTVSPRTTWVAIALVTLPLASCSTIRKVDDRFQGKAFGAAFDDLCIAGKFRDDAAEWMNANQSAWKQHGDYTDGRQPSPVKKGDRVFNGDCSEFTKRLLSGDVEGAIEALDLVAEGGAP